MLASFWRSEKTIKLSEDSDEITLDKADKKKWEALNKALFESKSFNKSTYASWARHFTIGIKVRSVVFKAMLATGYRGMSY